MKKNPQVSPISSVGTAIPVTQGKAQAEVCMNFFGLAYSQIDIGSRYGLLVVCASVNIAASSQIDTDRGSRGKGQRRRRPRRDPRQQQQRRDGVHPRGATFHHFGPEYERWHVKRQHQKA